MSDAEQFYTWAVFLMFVGVMTIAFAAVAMGVLETRAKRRKQADLARDRQARDDKAYRDHADRGGWAA